MPEPASENNSMFDLSLPNRFEKYYQFMPFWSSLSILMTIMGVKLDSWPFVFTGLFSHQYFTHLGLKEVYREVQNSDE